ncbi:MAG: N-acetyltransferase [Chitinophagaceae bacterium]|nr:N-acetyltransferase [Chitinophagaceae bacterium]
MEIIQEDDGRKGAFRAIIDGAPAGEMTYVWAGDTRFIIDHTEVDARFNGKGVGKQLLMKAVEFARNRQLKILPLCPFAKAMFAKITAIRDVL